jgi:hypothetical protein
MGLETATILAISAGVSAAAAGTGLVMQYQAGQEQAKQSEMNADAQAKAIAQEQQRQQIESDENMRRAALEQKRFRAAQFSRLASSGALLGTGTALDIEADTWAQQQLQIADMQYLQNVGQRALGAQAQTVRAQGYSQAGAMRSKATGTAISGLAGIAGNAYQMWSTRPQPAQAQPVQ